MPLPHSRSGPRGANRTSLWNRKASSVVEKNLCPFEAFFAHGVVLSGALLSRRSSLLRGSALRRNFISAIAAYAPARCITLLTLGDNPDRVS